MPFHPTRRGVLGALAAAGFAFDDALAQPLAPTLQCHDGDEPTVRQTEGPYFKPSSPLRADLIEPDSAARRVELSGQVLTRSCRPVAQALLDLWHADERGEYDNAGFRFSRTSFPVCRGPHPLRPHLAAALPRPHPPLPRQGAGAAAARAHHPTLFSGRADEPPRRTVPPRAGDAHGRGRGRPRRAVRFRARHALVSRFRSSQVLVAYSRANFGIKGTLANL